MFDFVCGRIHVRPKHFFETLDKAESGASAKVNSLQLWQPVGIENELKNVAIQIGIKSLCQQQLGIRKERSEYTSCRFGVK